MNIAVVDGQGGGIGKTIIDMLRYELGERVNIIALGTNDYAAKSMLTAGASLCFSGEEAIVSYIKSNKLNCIVAPVGILCIGGLIGEVTANISEAFFSKDCIKYIIPLRKHGFYIPGAAKLELKELLQEIVMEIKKCQELVP